MSAPGVTAIQFEQQAEADGTNRTCGAACLSMVYRSLGKEVPQQEIWPVIAKANRFGSVASTTHLMAADALRRGFAGVAIQARHPLLTLRLCRDAGIRAILNLRLKHDAPTGHYAVLVGIDDKQVVLHDPFLGPERRLAHTELLELWQPRFPNAEIVGNVMLGIAAGPLGTDTCELCRTPFPASVPCGRCHEPVRLEPRMLLGCVSSTCIARRWNYLLCPTCDYMWAFELKPASGRVVDVGAPNGPSEVGPGAAAAPGAESAADGQADPWGLKKVFAELDKFSSLLLAVPALAAHPDLKEQLAILATAQTQLKQAQAEELVHQKARLALLAKLQKTASEKQEAHQKRVEELKQPSPPLDGNALGRALLRNLGLTE